MCFSFDENKFSACFLIWGVIRNNISVIGRRPQLLLLMDRKGMGWGDGRLLLL
jgi:hypothetical protein